MRGETDPVQRAPQGDAGSAPHHQHRSTAPAGKVPPPLDGGSHVSHSAHMATITIRELHMKTGHWVRTAARGRNGVLVLDRGRPAARLLPAEEEVFTPFARRKLVRGFEQLPAFEVDSAQLLEEDRR